MLINNLTYDDILKMGPEKGEALLHVLISRELSYPNLKTRALAYARRHDMKRYSAEEMLKFLEIKGGNNNDTNS